MMTSRRTIRATLLLLGAAFLAACAGIPGSGPVQAGRRVDAVDFGPMEILAPGPQPGATPSELVRGFLQSAAAFNNDNATARQFLAMGEQVRWHPRASVVIYPSVASLSLAVTRHGMTATEPAPATVRTAPTATSRGGSAATAARAAATPSVAATSVRSSPTSGDSSSAASSSGGPSSPAGPESSVAPTIGETASVSVTVPVVATIDQWGQYIPAAAGATATRTFGLVGTDAGWRITRLDDGILIDQDIFHSTFRALAVYFADTTGRFLVPDVRWFPVSGATTRAGLVSSLVTDLLNGPAAWLRPGVVTGAPRGTATTLDAVKVSDYVATVDLTPAARKADARQRLMLKAQLEETLTDDAQTVVPVVSVVVTVDQQVFDLQAVRGDDASPSGQPVAPVSPQITDTSLVGVDAQGAIARLDPVHGVTAVGGLGVPASPGNTDPAVLPGGRAFAVLTDGRSRLVYAVPSGATTTLIRGQDLVAPSFDPFGWVWSAQRDAGGVVLAGRPGAGVARVAVPWAAGADVLSLRISADGARALVVTDRPGVGGQVWVSAVVRNAAGIPSALATPVHLAADAQDVTGAAWADETHVVFLGRRAGGTTAPWTVEIGGELSAGPAVAAQSITTDGMGDVYVTTASGTVLSRVGAGWQEVKGLRWASMPG